MSGAIYSFPDFVAGTKGRTVGPEPSAVLGISIDSRTVEPGELSTERRAGGRAPEREAAAAGLRANPPRLRARNRRFSRMVREVQQRKDRDR